MLGKEEGRFAVEMARRSLTEYLKRRERIRPQGLPPVFSEERGVFVTLHLDGQLRGCIGYPYPVMPLGQAIVDSAVQAGTGDPRFSPVTLAELQDIEFEVTILTRPEIMTGERSRLAGSVQVGRHGLLVRRGPFSGLLLPQVASECGLDPEDFLCQTCLKAGLPVDAWLDRETEVQCFEAQIFSEMGPLGPVQETVLHSCENGSEG
ncbi:MAG: hypothetical protein A4E45_00711 [Methanosaeta sp. PtaB.Bin039]|nr:MAG: hypothetical protein A4E45_00711 [Methanosaeta sp. PtaB.Bin039]HOT07464.1 TIGR00296 family protein [Methanotrichaceae archaeon]HQF17011.1 TIGR00296 family protein [Methanotrichaceae archaeon]HQI91631.1 TIGR00296 family protein [Methanotrichaceae archaeon]HQJ28875.1 TIGR00296 family protein [Methanotrichaceae archaeon]